MIYVVLISVLTVAVVQINKKAVAYRNIRRDALRAWTQQAVKILMSKFEVLSANKISHEIALLDKYIDE